MSDGKNALLFEDNNVDSLLEAYAGLDSCRAGLIEEGKRTAAVYNWQNIAGNLSDIYRSLL